MFSIALRLFLLLVISANFVSSSGGGRISGTVRDSSGGAIPRAEVIATNLQTGLARNVNTGADGTYTFPVLSTGRYSLEFHFLRLEPYRRTDITVDANSSLVIDAVLQAGREQETINVTDTGVHVEAASTQLGEVISGGQMTAVPLNGRSFTDLLSLQPGVAPQTSVNSNTVQDVGAASSHPPAI